MPNPPSRETSRGISREASGRPSRGIGRAISRGLRTAISGVPERPSRGIPDGASRETPKKYPMDFLRRSQKEVPKEVPKEVSKEEPKDISFFGRSEKEKIRRDDLRSVLRKSPSRISGKNKIYDEKYRIGLEKEIAQGKFYISKRDVKDRIRDLKDERFKLSNRKFEKGTEQRRREIEHEIDYLKKRSGIK